MEVRTWNIRPSRYAKRSKSDVNRWRRGASVRIIRTISRVTTDKSRSFWQLLPRFIEATHNAEKRKRAISLSVLRDTFPPEGSYRYVLRANETEGRKSGMRNRQRDISLDKRAVSPAIIIAATQFGHVCSVQRPSHPPTPQQKRNNPPDKFPAGRARAVKCVTVLFRTVPERRHTRRNICSGRAFVRLV